MKEKILCFNFFKDCEMDCNKQSCRYWINHSESKNCTLIAADNGPKTLQEIGDIFGVTRMRICQIEKSIKSKLVILESKIT